MKLARTKTKKFRGSMTHGKGYKGGRGAGLRGGRGNAGLHKHKYMYMMKYMPNHFGVHGFKRPQSVIRKEHAINVGQLSEKFPGKKEIDLTKAGYDKLLGGGSIQNSVHVTVKKATASAVEKISAKGGEVKTKEKPTE
ncbi:MAG: uL15m family ribosomal protein [Methanobacteriota archaeon]